MNSENPHFESFLHNRMVEAKEEVKRIKSIVEKKGFIPKEYRGRMDANRVLEYHENNFKELQEKINGILQINFNKFLLEKEGHAIYLAKDFLHTIRQFAYINNFLYLIDEQFKKEIISFTDTRVYKLKNKDIKEQFLILRKYFEIEDFIKENSTSLTNSSLEAKRVTEKRAKSNKHSSLDVYDNKRLLWRK
jgi:hypothetical protein